MSPSRWLRLLLIDIIDKLISFLLMSGLILNLILS